MAGGVANWQSQTTHRTFNQLKRESFPNPARNETTSARTHSGPMPYCFISVHFICYFAVMFSAAHYNLFHGTYRMDSDLASGVARKWNDNGFEKNLEMVTGMRNNVLTIVVVKANRYSWFSLARHLDTPQMFMLVKRSTFRILEHFDTSIFEGFNKYSIFQSHTLQCHIRAIVMAKLLDFILH